MTVGQICKSPPEFERLRFAGVIDSALVTKPTIAIVGAAGKIGFSTSKFLREAGFPVRAILRNNKKANLLTAIGCDVAVADLQNSTALSAGIAGADAVQIILPPPPQAKDVVGEMLRYIESMTEALELARPNRVLAISDYGAHLGAGVGMPFVFGIFEERLRQLDLEKLFLRSAEHMEGWAPFIPGAIATGVLPSLHHPVDVLFPTVSAPDVGLISAGLLRDASTGLKERTIHVEGPQRYSADDVAAALSQLLGRRVGAQELPRSQWPAILQQGLSASAAKLVIDVYEAHNKGGLIDVEPNNGQVLHGKTEMIDALRPLVPATGEPRVERS